MVSVGGSLKYLESKLGTVIGFTFCVLGGTVHVPCNQMQSWFLPAVDL